MMSQLQDEIREENDPLSITEIEKEIPSAKEPARSILYSVLAGMYYDYYQQVRWQLYDRTKTTDFKKEDINTWDADDFHKKIGDLYLQSIKEEKLLQQTKLDAYSAIIIKGNMRHLRPTLYDLLAHRALGYFENDERDISNPAYAFEIDGANAFDPAADFITRKFPTRDELSLHHKALLTYQKLIAFHLKDAKPDALIDADLARLNFVRNKSVHPDKQQLYFNAVNHIANQYGNTPAAAQAWYMLAEFHETNAATYKPYGDTTYRLSRVKAREICEKVLLQKDSSEGRTNCHNLLIRLKAPDMQVSIEKVNVPGQPFRVLMGYRNFNTVYLRIVKPDAKLKAQMEERYGDKYWNALVSAPALKKWEQSLPATGDMQFHNAEIQVDDLPIGEYIILASTQKDFSEKKSMLGARFFYVSNISYIHSGTDYVVLNRESGQPLANASVQIWENKYDYTTSKNVKQKEKSYKTNENGFFQRERKLVNNNYSTSNFALDISHGDDRLFMNDWIYDYYYNNKENSDKYSINTFLFIDRAIYRPGQTVYFKGIVLQKQEDDKSTVVTNYHGHVQLTNANGEVVDTIEVSTNEFGSFNGKFQLPQTGLTGNFSISSLSGTTSNGYAGFRVEEYKRPKFFVQYEPIKGTYKVNDKIKVTGTAKAYAGNNIDGAAVKYRVVRQARWMYPWMSWRWWYPSEPQEIAHGELKTDKDGKFIVEFTAMPDLKMDKKNDPVFTYTIYADVTDINGETRSGEESVDVSYKALKIVASIPDRLPTDSLSSLSIFTQNMGGQFEPATINVKISKLNEEKRLIRPRYWDRPDQFVMSKEQYVGLFPHDEYDNETDMKSWPKGEKQFDKTDSTN
ncbi:MAG TPA: MG2 domain-containing protein, partial [Chitinophagaceae bacterium]|nr:MG2 domain-containing protein [Chitinophagaceae bacterium]